MSSHEEEVKTVEVEPAAEGPRMRVKKPLSEAQLAALRKGREKLAEKRKASMAEEVKELQEQSLDQEKPLCQDPPLGEPKDTKKEEVPVKELAEDETHDSTDNYSYSYVCTIM